MAVIDPSGFTMTVQLRAGDTVFPLWLGGGEVNGRSLFFGDDPRFVDVPIVESVDMEIGFGYNIKLSVNVVAPHDLGLALLQSELFRMGNHIEVQIGYPKLGLFTPWAVGMTTQPSFSLQEEGLTGTVVAEGAAFAAQRSRPNSTFSNTTYAAIIEEIAERDSNRWELEIPGQRGSNDPLYADRVQVSQGQRSDWVFVMWLCRNAECEAHLRNRTDGTPALVVSRRAEMYGGEPRYNFVHRGQIDHVNKFPLFSFESSGEGVWLPEEAVAGTRTDDVDPMTGDPVDASSTQGDRSEVIPRTGEGNIAADRAQEAIDSEAISASPSSDAARMIHHSAADRSVTSQERVNQAADEGAVRGGFSATATSIGLPDLFPGEVIRISNMGIFSGNFLVQSITQHVAPGEWTMTMGLLTNTPGASGDAISDALLEAWPDYNDQEPREVTDAEGGGTEREAEGGQTV